MLHGLMRLLRPGRKGSRAGGGSSLGVEALEPRDCPSAAADWPMYNHDPGGSRTDPAESVLSPAAVKQFGLSVRWQFDTAGSVSGTPAVVHRVVYDGDLDGNFYALRDARRHPVLLWQRNVGAPITGSPLVLALTRGKSEVIFGDQAGYVYGLDAATGAVDWRVLPNTTSSQMAIYGSAAPVALGGTTYVAIGVSSNEEGLAVTPDHPRFTSRGSVVLLNPASGQVVWQTYTITDAESAAGAAGATVWSTLTYDARTHTLYVTTGNNFGKPATPNSDAVLALDGATGRILWSTQATPGDTFIDQAGPSPSTPDFDFGDSPQVYRLRNGRTVVGAGQKSGVYYVLDAATGAVLHALPLEPGGALGGLFADTAVDQRAGLVLVNGINWPHPESTLPTGGDLFGVSLAGGRRHWDFQTPRSPDLTGVAVADGVVYFQSLLDGNLYALDERTGRLLAKALTAGSSSGPAVARGRLYEGTGFAFGANEVGEPNVSGSIVAVGLRLSGPAVDPGTRRAERQNMADILAALSLSQQASPRHAAPRRPNGAPRS
jgi:polyvinyl alcohol dehydrogenase (cytochrome)